MTEFDLQGDKVVNISILRCQYSGHAVPHDAPRTAVFFEPCGSDFYGKQLQYAPRP